MNAPEKLDAPKNLDAPEDPFAFHPELRGKIIEPSESFFRTFTVESVFSDKPELQWVLSHLHSDQEREQSRTRTLTGHTGDLWVFAYGSLMWDPAIRFREVRRAQVTGYARKFILKDIYGGRGVAASPGLMAALDRGDQCEGLAFRIAADEVEAETELLWRREVIGPGYSPSLVDATIGGAQARVLTFLADHDCATVCPEISREKQISFLRNGSGFLGTSRDYLANIVHQFTTLGIVDEDCASLLREVDGAPPTTAV